MLGGDSRHHRFTEANVADLAAALAAIAESGAKVVVTPSRRTPPALAGTVRTLCGRTGGWFWDGTGENPYIAILAHADHLVVTADSVNMLGEAAATGKPIHLFTARSLASCRVLSITELCVRWLPPLKAGPTNP
jgi:uncharacterized protein